uniref:Uncharacterized protein n=1 Tax=Ixodes ricinus TaxID=34613 RepID=A0A6B0UNR6_IXORI
MHASRVPGAGLLLPPCASWRALPSRAAACRPRTASPSTAMLDPRVPSPSTRCGRLGRRRGPAEGTRRPARSAPVRRCRCHGRRTPGAGAWPASPSISTGFCGTLRRSCSVRSTASGTCT